MLLGKGDWTYPAAPGLWESEEDHLCEGRGRALGRNVVGRRPRTRRAREVFMVLVMLSVNHCLSLHVAVLELFIVVCSKSAR